MMALFKNLPLRRLAFALLSTPVLAADYTEEFPVTGSVGAAGWSLYAFLNNGGSTLSDLSAATVAVGVSDVNAGYAFFAPQVNPNTGGDLLNKPALIFTQEHGGVPVNEVTFISFDWIGDNTDANVRVAIKVAGVWYASAASYVDSRNNPGQTATWRADTFSPSSFTAATNWFLLQNTTLGSTLPLSVGAAASVDLSGTVESIGLLIDAGVAPAAAGDHLRVGRYTLSTGVVTPPATTPNVLLIVVDDLNDVPKFMGRYPDAKTPNMDRLAARGTVFCNAHANYPLCGPSRASFMSGLSPVTLGFQYHMTNAELLDRANSLGATLLDAYFRNRGYKVFSAGKIYHAGHPPAGADMTGGSAEFGAAEGIHYSAAGTSTDWGVPSYGGSDSNFSDKSNADFAVARLQEAHAGSFLLMVGFVQPHVPWYTPQSYMDKFPVGTPGSPLLTLPRYEPDDFSDISDEIKNRCLQSQYPRTANFLDQREAIMQAYLACVNFTDYYLGKVLDALDASPYATNTIIVLMGDNGYHLGEKNTYQKETLWERSSHVPLVIVDPRMPAGQRCSRTVSLLDIYPTLVDLVGLPPNERVEGRNLKPLLEDPGRPWDHPAITSYLGNNHAVQTERYRYSSWSQGSEELYDHSVDPDEITNLATNGSYGTVKAQLREFLPSNLLSSGFRLRFQPNSGKAADYLNAMLLDGDVSLYGEPAYNTNAIVEGMRLDASASNGWVNLTLVPASGYGAWRTNRFTLREQRDLGISGAAANTDGDSFPQLVEYALGLDPAVFDAPLGLRMTSLNGAQVPEISFIRAASPGDVDVRLMATGALIPRGWTPVAESIQGAALHGLNGYSVQNPGGNVYTAAPTNGIGAATNQFYRIECEYNP